MLQDCNSNDLIMPRDEFTFINDSDSLEDIVIYDLVVEYQAVVKIKRTAYDDIVEIKPEPQEHDPRDIIILYSSVIQQDSSSKSEITTMSQITIDPEEIVSAQESTFEKPQEEPEDWLKTLTRGKQQEKWGREGIYEADMLIITRYRIDTTPTNRNLINNI